MISLRSFATLTAAFVVALSVSGCADHATNPLSTSGLKPGSASFSAAKVTGSIDSRVLLNKTGDAILEVHSGTFDDGSNTAAPVGTVESLTYTIKNGNKTVVSRNVKFDKNVSSYFVHLNLCKTSGDDEDDDDGSSAASSCASKWLAAYTLSVTAKLKGLGSDGKGDATVTGAATVLYLPDIDLTQQVLSTVGAGGALTPAASVSPGVATTFSVPFPNNKPIVNGLLGSGTVPNAVGVQATCLVTVDGRPQLPFPSGVYNQYTNPNAFGYVGPVVQAINAGTSSPCQFTLSLPAGAHTIAVTAIVLYPGDYDVTNNSTATFTVTAAAGPPDVALGALQQQPIGGGGVVPLGSATVTAGDSLKLVQWITLKSGAPTGPLSCSVTLTNTTTASTPVTVLGTAPSSSAACVIPVLFPSAGRYSITSTVTPPAGDPDLTNNTATNTLVVVSGPPAATVTVGDIAYADPYNNLARNLLTAAGEDADTVHAGDLVTYTADLNVAYLVNTVAVNATCKVMEGSNDLTPKVTWLTGPALTAVPAGTAACVFKYAFDETDNVKHKHTLTVSVTTPGSTNNATSASLNGTITDVVRVHFVASPLQRVGNGVATTGLFALDTTKQQTAVKVQTTITNSTSHATAVDCVLSADSRLAQAAVGTVAGVPVAANSSAVCQFQVTPAQLGSYPIKVTVTPSATAPANPDTTGHVANGVLTVISSGVFTSIDLSRFTFSQKWNNLETSPAFPPEVLTVQTIDVNQLALLIVPAQQTLGQFTLSGQIINGSTAYPIGTVTGYVTQTLSATYSCNDVKADPGTKFTDALGSAVPATVIPTGFPVNDITFSASVCSAQTTLNGVAGYQSIAINFNESVLHNIVNPDTRFVWGGATGGSIQVKINLDFTLNPGGQPDHVSATINVPIDVPMNVAGANGGRRLWTESALPLSVVP